jgi:hypothetical protein
MNSPMKFLEMPIQILEIRLYPREDVYRWYVETSQMTPQKTKSNLYAVLSYAVKSNLKTESFQKNILLDCQWYNVESYSRLV